MARLALKLFGSYRLTLVDIPIEAIVSDKARALLAYLAVENDHPHPREKLVGLFWPEQNEDHARGSLSQALYHLRGTLGDRPPIGILPAEAHTLTWEPYLLVTPQEIQLNPRSDFETDVAAFTPLMAACKAHAHPPYKICEDCLRQYQEAARLYTGDFLDGFYLPKSMAFEEWATILREQLHLQVMEALEHLVVAFERRDELDQALAYAHRMVLLDELGEAGNQHMLRLLALMGRRGEALAQYASFHHVLAVQMGAEPGMEGKILYQHLRNEEAGTDLGNLPASLAPLIGRRQELDELWGMLRDHKHRLICVLGPGGSGKTRLALEAAHRQRYQFRDGVYFVPLSALGNGSSLLATIAEGLGITFRDVGDPKRQLLDYVRHKKVLLILDSFETVVESAGLVTELLSASEGSKALVTSRVRLNVSGEYIYLLEGMQVPPPDAMGQCLDYSSVKLFLEAARRVRPGYTTDSIEGVASICRLVDGMPLSLLLASTWVSDYSAQEIAAQISRSLDFLTVEWADLPERQRSLRATFEYSWDLLSPREQGLLMSLAVFRNPFSTQAAYQVAGASAQVLHALVGKSLLGSTAEGCYQMHDLVRQYSADKLAHAPNGQECTVRQEHSDYFLQRAADWSTSFKSSHQSVMLAEADKEIDDVQSAWEWASQQADLERLSQSLEGVLVYYSLRYRYQEGEHACQVAIEGMKNAPVGGERLNLEGWMLAWQANFYRLLGKMELARQSADRSLEKLMQAEAAGQDSRRGQALLWRERGYLTVSLPEQLDYHQRSAALFQALGDPWWQASSLTWAGELANRLGDHDLALNMHQQTMELSRAAGEPRLLARSLMNLAYDQIIHWTWETGAKLMEEAASWYRSIGDLGSQANAELHLAVSLIWTGRYPEGCAMLELALPKLHQLGDRFYITYGTLALAGSQMNAGRYERAGLTLQEGLVFARQDSFRREETFAVGVVGCLAMVQGDSAQALADLQHSVAGFRQMGFAGELGMALGGLALAQHRLGQEEQAWASLRESLHIAVETNSRFTLYMLAAALVVLLADAARWEQALEAYSAVMTDPIVANSRWFSDMVGDWMDLAKVHLPEDIRWTAEARGREGDVFDVLGRLVQEIDSWGMDFGRKVIAK
jgi:predicted ATPase/DNA-binding SARP family transcriptional activator